MQANHNRDAAVLRTRAAIRLPAGSRIAVAMSGGVDSSTVAALLVEAGYEVFGLTARLYDLPDDTVVSVGSCCAPRDAADARATASKLGIRHYVVDERAHFETHVMARFADDYASARTPNPCVECNRHLKFDRLLERALLLGAEALATGHYARLDVDAAGDVQLYRGQDRAKDQAYFLHALRPESARWLRFPLGALDKAAVRDEARRLDVPVADKPESMDICFVAGKTHADWVADRDQAVSGTIIDVTGMRIGRHDNLARFTVGQRRGLGVGAGGEKRYVVDKRSDGTVVVGDHAALAVEGVCLAEFGTIAGNDVAIGAMLALQWRHRGPTVDVVVSARHDDVVTLRCLTPIFGVAPGQSGILLAGERVVGGGIIDRIDRIDRAAAAAVAASPA